MICFPHSKINLGLHVTAKRPDGFHDLQTSFYPVKWCDALEVAEHPRGKKIEICITGLPVQGQPEDNILYKAWLALNKEHHLPPLLVHLLKKIPMGAGLGGGSSDAAFFLELLNKKFSLGISEQQLFEIASNLGSDCPFFLQKKPVLAGGRGNVFSPLDIDLSTFYIMIVYPQVHSNTALAYAGVTPRAPVCNLADLLEKPVTAWKNLLLNDFEPHIFARFPVLDIIKKALYRSGALYAAMSGSGSAIFGIYDKEPSPELPEQCVVFLQEPDPGKIL